MLLDRASPKLVVEVFQRRHQDAVVRHILDLENGEFALGLPLNDQPDLKDIADTYQLGGGQFWVEQVDGNVGGIVGLFALGNGDADRRKMFPVSRVAEMFYVRRISGRGSA
jgi:hypothetical protein